MKTYGSIVLRSISSLMAGAALAASIPAMARTGHNPGPQVQESQGSPLSPELCQMLSGPAISRYQEMADLAGMDLGKLDKDGETMKAFTNLISPEQWEALAKFRQGYFSSDSVNRLIAPIERYLEVKASHHDIQFRADENPRSTFLYLIVSPNSEVDFTSEDRAEIALDSKASALRSIETTIATMKQRVISRLLDDHAFYADLRQYLRDHEHLPQSCVDLVLREPKAPESVAQGSVPPGVAPLSSTPAAFSMASSAAISR